MKWTVVRVRARQLKDLVEGKKGNIWSRSGRVMLGVSWEANVNCLSGTDSNSDVLHESLMHYMTTSPTPSCPTTYGAHWFLQLHWKLGMDVNCEVRNHPMQMLFVEIQIRKHTQKVNDNLPIPSFKNENSFSDLNYGKWQLYVCSNIDFTCVWFLKVKSCVCLRHDSDISCLWV